MKTSTLAVALVLVLASTASAKNSKVYVFAEPAGTDTFQAVTRTLTDSVKDVEDMINGGITNGLRVVRKRDEARILVQVTSREEAQGELRLHVHVTADGHEGDLIGTSVHQWKASADDIGLQLSKWAKAHPER